MKNVLLIGDSIRLGYQSRVEKLLGKNVKVCAPEENCRYTKFALWGMFSWMEGFGNPKIDAAHWNTGIWDLHRCTADGQIFTPVDEYALYQHRMAVQMKSYTDNVIFANMTPGGKGLDAEDARINALINTNPDFVPVHLTAPMREWNNDVKRYNAAAEEVMAQMNIPVNDFYSAIIADTEKYICSDGVHMTDEGYDLLAKMTAEKILEMF